MKHFKGETIRWKDKKRICGIPCTFTHYIIDDDRLYIKTGFFKTEINEILLYRILDIKSSQNLGQKIVKTGNITLFCADQSDRTIMLKNVKNPVGTHRLISDIVEQERQERGIAGREISGAASFDMDNVDESCVHDTGHVHD